MTRTTCFDAAQALHDRRFRRKLTKYEAMDFVFLLGFAGTECRDPAFIPIRKMEDLALDLGWTGKAGEEQKQRRLAKWSAPGIELIELQDDGGIQINYLLDQEFEREDAASEPYSSGGHASDLNGSHANGSSANSRNGNGTNVAMPPGSVDHRNGSDRRQQNRRYSETPDSKRSRDSYWRKKMAEAGLVPAGDAQGNLTAPGGENLTGETENLTGETENLTGETENLTVSTSKPHALAGENSENQGENLTVQREVLPARVGDVKDVVGDLKNSLDSDYVSNVPADKNLTVPSGENLTQNLTAKNLTKTTSASGVGVANKPAAPPPRPELRPQDVPTVRHTDVRAVLKWTGDDPARWGAMWKALWNHCYSHKQLRCWDEGVVYFAWRLKVSPSAGPGAIQVNGKWLRGTILELLRKADAAYVPVGKGDAPPGDAPEESVDPAEQARVHQELLDIKAGWAAEEEAHGAALRAVITPLPERRDEGETDPETEDE